MNLHVAVKKSCPHIRRPRLGSSQFTRCRTRRKAPIVAISSDDVRVQFHVSGPGRCSSRAESMIAHRYIRALVGRLSRQPGPMKAVLVGQIVGDSISLTGPEFVNRRWHQSSQRPNWQDRAPANRHSVSPDRNAQSLIRPSDHRSMAGWDPFRCSGGILIGSGTGSVFLTPVFHSSRFRLPGLGRSLQRSERLPAPRYRRPGPHEGSIGCKRLVITVS